MGTMLRSLGVLEILLSKRLSGRLIIEIIILRLLWPYLQEFLANRAADYLEKRRQRKRQLKEEKARLAELVQDLPPALSPVPSEALPPSKLLTANTGWYTLAGLLIGSALSLILIIVLREED
jgi:hypothetical protein